MRQTEKPWETPPGEAGWEEERTQARYWYGGVEYRPDEDGTARQVKCPLTDSWEWEIDCMETQSLREASIPARFRQKEDWRAVCEACPFRNY